MESSFKDHIARDGQTMMMRTMTTMTKKTKKTFTKATIRLTTKKKPKDNHNDEHEKDPKGEHKDKWLSG